MVAKYGILYFCIQTGSFLSSLSTLHLHLLKKGALGVSGLPLSDFLLLFTTCRCPIYQTSVDTVCEEMVAPRFSSSSS